MVVQYDADMKKRIHMAYQAVQQVLALKFQQVRVPHVVGFGDGWAWAWAAAGVTPAPEPPRMDEGGHFETLDVRVTDPAGKVVFERWS